MSAPTMSSRLEAMPLAHPRPLRAPCPSKDTPRAVKMRKFDVVALCPDGEVKETQHLGPATPLFESAFSAFARGTLIATDTGPVAVEDLWPGMRVTVDDNRHEEVIWIGSMTHIPRTPGMDTPHAPLTRITAESFGLSRPMTDLLAGPAARILAAPAALRARLGGGKALCPVADFVDGWAAVEVTPPTPVKLYHIALRKHAVIRAAGLEMETFHPGPDFDRNMGMNMALLFMSYFPLLNTPADFGPLAYARLSADDSEAGPRDVA